MVEQMVNEMMTLSNGSDTAKISSKLEPVFAKYYAPNICLPLNMDEFAVPPQKNLHFAQK